MNENLCEKIPFETPELEIVKLSKIDIIATSGDDSLYDSENETEKDYL